MSTSDAPVKVGFPRAIHWRYLRCLAESLDGDGNITDRAIAAKLGLSAETLSRWKQRYPQLRKWVAAQLDELAGEKASAVVNRMATMALKGSVSHAELYLKAVGRVGGDAGQAPSVTVNILGGGPVPQFPDDLPDGTRVLEAKR